jgi:hypothetical protein
MNISSRVVLIFCFLLAVAAPLLSQEKMILLPKQVPGAPFRVPDGDDLFGKAYRWFLEGQPDFALDSLKKLIDRSGYRLSPENYYVVVAHYNESFSPLGLIHEGSAFLDTRFYGLSQDSLFYVFISRTPRAPSFLSVTITEKDSPFITNLPAFIGLFVPLAVRENVEAQVNALQRGDTWIDVRQFDIPEKFRKNSDLSFIVKSDLASEKFLAETRFDNTALERWSYGIAFGITGVDDVDFEIGSDGRIIIRPKQENDLATFGVVNYHFKPVDTKAKTFGTSLHVFGGARLAPMVEPIAGVGGGVSLGFIDLHLFVGYSLEFASVLKDEFKDDFANGQPITNEVDPFKLKLRGKFRYGIEIKFP